MAAGDVREGRRDRAPESTVALRAGIHLPLAAQARRVHDRRSLQRAQRGALARHVLLPAAWQRSQVMPRMMPVVS